MTAIVAIGAVSVGINLAVRSTELQQLGLTPGSYSEPSVARMAQIRQTLTSKRGVLPHPSNGGSVGNSANFLARAGFNCSMIGAGGNDAFGKAFVANCNKASLNFISPLEDGAITGYDFYLYDEAARRTIVLTQGANALLSPTRINDEAIQQATLLLIDGSALAYGPDSKAAVTHAIQVANAASVPIVLTLSSTGIVASYRQFFETYAPQVEMVAGNLEQAAVLVGLPSEAVLDDVREKLSQTSINVIVTLDEAGVFGRINNEEYLVSTQPIDAIDSTGAGDGFLGAFLAARMQNASIEKALAVGNFVAGEVIQHIGAQLPTEIDVPQLLQDAFASTEAPKENISIRHGI